MANVANASNSTVRKSARLMAASGSTAPSQQRSRRPLVEDVDIDMDDPSESDLEQDDPDFDSGDGLVSITQPRRTAAATDVVFARRTSGTP